MLARSSRPEQWAWAGGSPDVRHRGGLRWKVAPIPRRWRACRPRAVHLHGEGGLLSGGGHCTSAWHHPNTCQYQDPAGLSAPECRSPSVRGWWRALPFTPVPATTCVSTGEQDMSEALDRVRDLWDAGFSCLPHYNDTGQMVAVQGVRVRAGHIETVLIYGEHDALGARCRDDDHGSVVWHQAGSTAEVIAALLDLPAPGTRHAPELARTASTDLWLPHTFSR